MVIPTAPARSVLVDVECGLFYLLQVSLQLSVFLPARLAMVDLTVRVRAYGTDPFRMVGIRLIPVAGDGALPRTIFAFERCSMPTAFTHAVGSR